MQDFVVAGNRFIPGYCVSMEAAGPDKRVFRFSGFERRQSHRDRNNFTGLWPGHPGYVRLISAYWKFRVSRILVNAGGGVFSLFDGQIGLE